MSSKHLFIIKWTPVHVDLSSVSDISGIKKKKKKIDVSHDKRKFSHF